MRNIERAKIALGDLYPQATVRAEAHTVNVVPYGTGYAEGSAVLTCYEFRITLADGRRVLCREMYTDDFFSEMSIDEIGALLRDICVADGD